MRLVFQPSAKHNADTYREHDAALWAELRKVLVAIRDQTPRARDTRLDVLGGTAWLVNVHVPGRDEAYQVVWAPSADDVADVVHLGPRLS
ncbi:MAG: hypothetical protein LBU50_00355 [Cellulomonas sp.]|jgi:hypothetical protein|nr:hypothetical protein [Cellulomonas sp.]